MKNTILVLIALLFIKKTVAQGPVAGFDINVEYVSGYASVLLKNTSTNYNNAFWDLEGDGNYVPVNAAGLVLKKVTTSGLIRISLIAQSGSIYDTAFKKFNIRLKNITFDYFLNDTGMYAPLTVKLKNSTIPEAGDTLSFTWEIINNNKKDSFTNTDSLSYEFMNPGNSSITLIATDQDGYKAYAHQQLIIKDSAQKNEIDYLTGTCTPENWMKHTFYVYNDTLYLKGCISGNCCTKKTATVSIQQDTVYVKTFETGQRCTCGSEYTYQISVPGIQKSTYVSFDNEIILAPLVLSSVKEIKPIKKLIVSPNPAHNKFTITLPENIGGGAMIQLIDITGQLAYKVNINDQHIISIDAEGLNPGVYVLKVISSSGNIYTSKLILQ